MEHSRTSLVVVVQIKGHLRGGWLMKKKKRNVRNGRNGRRATYGLGHVGVLFESEGFLDARERTNEARWPNRNLIGGRLARGRNRLERRVGGGRDRAR